MGGVWVIIANVGMDDSYAEWIASIWTDENVAWVEVARLRAITTEKYRIKANHKDDPYGTDRVDFCDPARYPLNSNLLPWGFNND